MRLVRTKEGFLVDEDTGVVYDDRPVDYEHPEYRLFSYEDLARKSHYSPLGWRVRARDAGCLSVGEDEALRALGSKGLVIYRCLVNAGVSVSDVIEVLKRISAGIKGYGKVYRVASSLSRSLSRAVRNALIRWNAKALGVIDLKYASFRLGSPVTRGRVPQVIAEVDGLKVQVTKSKIDVSSRATDEPRVRDVVLKLRRFLGTELTPPKPKVATVVLDMPFRVNLGLAARLGGVHQGYRVKLMGEFWTALIFPNTVNMYVNLRGDMSRIDTALLECVPKLCMAALL